ncbi:MAG: sensor domain-containing diguanylate cyclase [Brevinematales bacterium]|nr:sensor domain-containing diguanylate cyclase [Brevinematales bacterium]
MPKKTKVEIASDIKNLNHHCPEDFVVGYQKKDRALKIIKEMSEFLRILDIRESDILKTMIVRFAIESVEASAGSLIVYDNDKNILTYQNTFVYDSNNKIILDTSIFESYSELLDVQIFIGEGLSGDAYLKGIPIIVEDLKNSIYSVPPLANIMKIDVNSAIAVPLKVDNEIPAVLEIVKSKDKEPLTKDDLETIMIIANFASATLENAKLFLWAIHDSLTGLYNNHYFYKEFEDEIEKSKRYNRVFSLVMFDIDDFKQINDRYGHIAGDRALRHLSDCIKKTIRKDVDIAARYGGDEFVIIFPNTSAENAHKVSMRLLETVRNTPVNNGEHHFNITLSMGISEFPKDGDETYFLFNHADEALYESKRKGKNRITIYNPSEK